jgi:hypothetical protein
MMGYRILALFFFYIIYTSEGSGQVIKNTYTTSAEISSTIGGNYFKINIGYRKKRFEPVIGINHQLIYKNSQPISKQEKDAEDYPKEFLFGYHLGVDYSLKEAKVKHILSFRFQHNKFYEQFRSPHNDEYIKLVYGQLFILYGLDIFSKEFISMHPYIGINFLRGGYYSDKIGYSAGLIVKFNKHIYKTSP